MAGSVSRSFRLLGASWTLLGRDPKLLLLPLTSLVASLVVAVAFYAAGIVNFSTTRSSVWNLIGLYAFYAVIAFIGICCNSVIVAVAMERLAGREATIRDGWTVVRGRLPQVIRWALVSATVGVAMRVIQERLGIVGAVATWIGNLAWSLATFFVVPVLLFEPVGVGGAIKRSASVFRKRWGEQVTAQLAIGAGLIVVWLPIMVVAMLLLLVSPVVSAVVFVVGLLAVITISSTLNEIFTAALYRYAVSGAVPPGWSAEDFDDVIKPRRGPFGRRKSEGFSHPARPDQG